MKNVIDTRVTFLLVDNSYSLISWTKLSSAQVDAKFVAPGWWLVGPSPDWERVPRQQVLMSATHPPGSQAHPHPPSKTVLCILYCILWCILYRNRYLVHTILQQILSSDKMNRVEVVVLIILPVVTRASRDMDNIHWMCSNK